MTETESASRDFIHFQEALATNYRIEREIGQGGMATVYLAHDLTDDRPVALKLLNQELGASLGADRFLREIRVAQELQHPNIIGVIDCGNVDGRLFYTMPFVEGASLRDRLDREKQLPIEDAIAIIRQVASALDFAHAKGVVHRDIKPENILLSGDKAFVADFGIARAVSVAGGEQLTRTGIAIGTPAYMSPEQALESKDVNAQSDIYSLGCVMFELLAGQLPFTGPTAMALLARHSLDSVPSLRTVRGTVSDAIDDAIQKAMAKVPADRYRTAGDFVAAMSDDVGAALRRTSGRRISQEVARHTTRETRARRLRVAMIAVPLLVVGGWAAWKFSGSAAGSGRAAGPGLQNIAVLYFEDRSPDRSLAYLADGLTESLIRELTNVTALHVISRNGVIPFKTQNPGADSIGKLLKVGTIVSGTVQPVGDSLRVSVELTEPAGSNIGTATIARPRSESFELQDDLAREVSTIIRSKLGEQVQVVEARAGTRSTQAYEAFQRALQQVTDAERLLASGNAQAASAQLWSADTAFGKVENLDRNWVRPVVEHGWVSYRQSRLLGVFDRPAYSKWIEAGLTHAERAISLAPRDPDALELRGTLRYWRWLLNILPEGTTREQALADAEADLNAAVDVKPNLASAWNVLSHLRYGKSQTSAGKLAALRAYEADPYLVDANRTVWRLFQGSLDLGDVPEARKWCAEGQRRFADDFRFTECQLWLLTMRGSEKPTANEIWAAHDAFIKASPAPQQEFITRKAGMMAAIALIRADLPDSARAVAVRSRGNSEIDPPRELTSMEAIVRAQVGDSDDAFRLLNVFLATNPQQRGSAGEDESWWFEDLRNDPRWETLRKG